MDLPASRLPEDSRSANPMRVLKLFITSFLPAVIKPLHALWNEVLAFTFFALALAVGIGPLRRGYRELDGDPANTIKFAAAAFLDVLMIYFAIQSYRRAKRISRS
jgi:hypothetical protein